MQKKRSDWRRITMIAAATAAFMWVMLYAPTPYVVYEPGIAVSVKPMISIEAGDKPGNGDFLLTAVKLTEPNFLRTFSSMWDANKDVHLRRDVFRGYTQEQFAVRQQVIMQGSQNNAIEAAYHYADLPYSTKADGLLVADILIGGDPARSGFKSGDLLHGLRGGEQAETAEQLLASIQSLNQTGVVSFDVDRDGQRTQISFPRESFSEKMTNEQLLDVLGIKSLTELRSLEPDDPENRITIAAGEIGGPSAGLVFALQALELLTEGDLSGGSRIAATGTITVDGRVGAIGGIKQKIVIASEKGAKLFLVPAGNFKEAEAKAKALGTAMKIASVSTLQEAVQQVTLLQKAAQ
ncbi:PDZ domain-containing protein [Paenibacillus endophyticus]|uniref:endopeptidase La n=1 Tax=Paenibacillus endophyticus TaxID=1294268 RepID=A0A7W5GAB2_9BACL|nr:S16 family serine protease [Paenibacillus endophyticus]MBB3152153.1 PDZ domain-containing protein [Paenibacillus endophyticus]